MILENCSYLRDARVGKEAKALKKKGHKVSVISPEPSSLPSYVLIEGYMRSLKCSRSAAVTRPLAKQRSAHNP